MFVSKDVTKGHGGLRVDFPGGWEGDEVNLFDASQRDDVQRDVYDHTARLFNWRKTKEVVHNGRTLHFVGRDNTYAYFRYNDQEAVFVFINNSNEAKAIPWENYAEITKDLTDGRNVLSGQPFTPTDLMQVPSRESLVVEFKCIQK